MTTITTAMAMANWGSWASNAKPAATQSMSAKKWINWLTKRRSDDGRTGGGSWFGPSAAKRAAAMADERPGSTVRGWSNRGAIVASAGAADQRLADTGIWTFGPTAAPSSQASSADVVGDPPFR